MLRPSEPVVANPLMETKYNRRRRNAGKAHLGQVWDDQHSRRRGLRTINPECQPNRGRSRRDLLARCRITATTTDDKIGDDNPLPALTA